jgi:uncharacterized membrane protein YqaE (UPF0057 family)
LAATNFLILKQTTMRLKILSLLTFLILTTSVNYSSAAVIAPSSTSSIEPDPAKVKAAIAEFKSLSKKERKVMAKESKKELKAYKAAKKAGKEPSTNTLLLVILAILLPPLAVYLHQGEINSKFWISLLLTLLFWLPGVIYALIVILG